MPATANAVRRGALGPVLTSAQNGTITGWDISESADYGLLSAGISNGTQLEAFDLKTAKITKLGTFQRGMHNGNVLQLIVLKILAGDVALIDDLNFNPQTFQRNDTFPTAVPANNATLTGKWTPPHPQNLLVYWVADNQHTTTNAIMADRNNPRGALVLFDSDVAQNTFQPALPLPSNQVFQFPYPIAQDTVSDEVVAASQTNGNPFNPFEPPSFDAYDLKTGKHATFSPSLGSGAVMGIAIDSTTHMMCTTTADDSNVEFVNLKTQTGFAVTLPGSSGEGTGGAAVAVDSVHHLFIVTQPEGALPSATVYIYDEQGNVQESIGGFDFSNEFSALFAYVEVNPTLRIGYASTANADQLQSFSY